MRGFTKTGQPIQGRRYLLDQPGILPKGGVEVIVVGKAYGKHGNSDLVSVMLEEVETGGRDWLDWPIEASEGAPPITFKATS